SSRRRHTRCYRDWSSDVCSSDLEPSFVETRLPLPKRKASTPEHPQLLVLLDEPQRKRASRYCNRDAPRCYGFGASPRSRTSRREIGRASCRERVWNGEVGVVWKN